MNKRILITSTDLMMIQFLVPHVKNLVENGFEVELACSNVGGRLGEVRETLGACVQAIHEVGLVRSPVSVKNMSGYKDMKNVISKGSYDIIWTNEPVMGVATRLAARKKRKLGTKVVYMVHGFHFFTGAPLLYWLCFYPIEYLMSFFADKIITINQEDYRRACKMHAKSVSYIHGIGMNTERLQKNTQQSNIREELGIGKDKFFVLSVGELNKNKNHKVVIRALGKLKDKDIYYAICGKGDQLEKLQILAKECGIEKNIYFLGYRKDVVDICSQADVFVLPSYREGLSLASLEAMYCGLPIITSKVRGSEDYLENGKSGYICDADDVNAFMDAIQTLKNDKDKCKEYGQRNRIVVQKYCIENVRAEVKDVFVQI